MSHMFPFNEIHDLRRYLIYISGGAYANWWRWFTQLNQNILKWHKADIWSSFFLLETDIWPMRKEKFNLNIMML